MRAVTIADATAGLKPALEEIFAPYVGVKGVIPGGGIWADGRDDVRRLLNRIQTKKAGSTKRRQVWTKG
jgi:hypothetical protein